MLAFRARLTTTRDSGLDSFFIERGFVSRELQEREAVAIRKFLDAAQNLAAFMVQMDEDGGPPGSDDVEAGLPRVDACKRRS